MVSNYAVTMQNHADGLYDLQAVLLHVCRCSNGRYYDGWRNDQFISVLVTADNNEQTSINQILTPAVSIFRVFFDHQVNWRKPTHARLRCAGCDLSF